MDIPRKPRSPRTARIKAAKVLKNVPTALLLKKKAECDAKALKIVEQMIEPEVNVDWLLQNLGQINKSHMDDVVEERSIVKLCGYPLCDNPLKKVVQKQYQISTLRNKVYDISRMKNFCSYGCYTATEYLMEQMLTSPLWVREDEEIPKFQILLKVPSRCKSLPGVEVDLTGIKLPDDMDDAEEAAANESEEKGTRKSSSNANKTKAHASQEYERQKDDGQATKEAVNDSVGGKKQKREKCSEKVSAKESGEKETKENDENRLIAKFEGKIGEVGTELRSIDAELTEERAEDGTDKEIPSNEAVEENKFPRVSNDKPKAAFSANIPEKQSTASSNHPRNSKSTVSHPVIGTSSESQKIERRKARQSSKKPISFETLTSRVENSLKEWITEETICLLHGEETEKRKILENVRRQEKYAVLCKKLNHLQLEEEREESPRISELKPAPHFSALQEEAKTLELKVHAFFEGRTVVEPTTVKVAAPAKQEENDSETIQLPLIDSHAPKALRRRIFLDKLNKVLPDLLRALAGSGSSTQYSYTSERCASVKALVATFSLSATNITFKTAEWTLVALIIIKLLSFVDPRLNYLLSSKQASMYTSMILMSYKLDSNYLETLILSTTRSSKTTRDEDS